MATKPTTTTHGASKLPAWQVAAVILTPAWIILATLLNGVLTGEVAL
ncbi:MAG TPA: hypothetical protein VEZ70_14430 [Allosphingosinicella sp.]|nr:hypothetical protein [Allosphingosinicella sp.]